MAEIWQQLQTERRQERAAHVSSLLPRSQWKHWWVKSTKLELSELNGGVRRFRVITQQSKDREAEITECLIVGGVKRRGRANHHLCIHCLHGRFFFIFFKKILDLKLNRGNKKRMHAQSSQSSLPGGSIPIRRSLCIMKDAVICEGLRASR